MDTKKLIENVGFKAVYRRLNYAVGSPFGEFRGNRGEINYDVEWDGFTTALGFEERSGIVNMGARFVWRKFKIGRALSQYHSWCCAWSPFHGGTTNRKV